MRKILAKTVNLLKKNETNKKIKNNTHKENRKKFYHDGTVNDYEQGI